MKAPTYLLSVVAIQGGGGVRVMAPLEDGPSLFDGFNQVKHLYWYSTPPLIEGHLPSFHEYLEDP